MSPVLVRVVAESGITSGMNDIYSSELTDDVLPRCMGYHSEKDPRLPDKFICFDCRLRADPSWELIEVELHSTLIVKLRELACFRSVLDFAWLY